MTADGQRRFGGVARLYGADGASRIAAAHVAVVGLGGVGSWAVEALARSGVGALTLIDLDMVAESNTNRQIQALEGQYGKAKVDAMAERIAAIHPACRVTRREEFVTPENASQLLDGLNAVVDAIDQARVKAAMIAHARDRGLCLVTAGAAGGQSDPLQIRADDLSKTVQDPLLAKVRALLRREYGFPKGTAKKFGVTAIYSTEALRYPDAACTPPGGPAGLHCAGFGSSVCVTAAFGLAAAASVLNHLAKPS